MAKQLNVNLAFNADTKQVKTQLQDLQNQLTKIMQMSSQKNGLGMTKELQEATQAAASLKAHLTQATNVDTGKLDLGLLNKSLKDAGVTLDQYRQKLQQAGPAGQQAFNSLASSILKAEIPLKQCNTLLNSFATTLKNTARWQISSSILHGFMGSLQSAFYYAKDLNESLNNIRIVTGYNTDQMAKFAQEANKAAQALSTTTTEYTNASLIYYQQGLSDDEVKKRTDVTVKMANVTRESAEEVSQQMTAIWNNFDDGSKSLEYYSDVVTALGAATASSSAEIAQGLEKFAAVADTVGLSYEYATSALATVTATTRQSADVVGNAFKTLFARLEGLKLGETLDDGTDLNKYSKALNEIGVNIKDTNGEMKAMDQILDELGEKWKDLARDQQMALAQTVGGVRQYTQLIALMDNWDFFQENLGVARDSEGTLQKQAKIYAESWDAAKDRVKAAAEDIYNELINDKFFIDLNNGFSNFLNLLNNVIKGIGGLQGTLALLGGVITRIFAKDLATGLDKFIYNLQNAEKVAIRMREETLASVSKMTQGSDLGTVYEHMVQPQQAFIDNVEKMNAVERQTAEILLDEHEKRVQKLADLSKEKERIEELLTAEERRAENLIKASRSEKHSNYYDNAVSGLKKVYNLTTQVESAIEEAFKINSLNDPNGINKIADIFRKLSLEGVHFSEEIQNAFNILRSGTGDSNAVANALEVLYGSLTKVGEAGGFDERALEILRNALNTLIPDSERAAQEFERLSSLILDAASAEEKFTIEEKRTEEQTKKLIEILNNIQDKKLTAGQVIVNLAQGLSSLAMAINTLKGLKDIWSDEENSFGEKLLSTVTALGIAIPMLVTGLKSLKTSLAELPLLFISFSAQLTGTEIKTYENIIATKGLSVALKEAAKSALFANTALGPLWAVLAVGAAVIGTVILASYGLYKAYNEDADAAKTAAEAAENLAKEYDRVKQSYDELKKSLEDYNSAKKALDELTEGTQEWKDAVIELNNQVLELLDKYPQLIDYVESSNGILSISDQGQNALLESQSQEIKNAYQAKLIGQIQKDTAQNKSDFTDLGRRNLYEQAIPDSDLTVYAGVDSKSVEKAINAIIKHGDIILQNSEMLAKSANITQIEAETLLLSKDEMINLANKVEANTKANELRTEELGKSILEERGLTNTKFATQLASLIGKETSNLSEKYFKDYSDKTRWTVRKEYLEAHDEFVSYERGAGNKSAKYYYANGESVEIDDNTARAQLAAAKAEEEATNKTNDYVKALKKVEEISPNATDGILNVVAGIEDNINNLTKKDVEELKRLSEELKNEDLEPFGVTKEEFQTTVKSLDQDLERATEDIKKNLLEKSKAIFDGLNLDEVTIEGQKAIAKVLNRAVILGSEESLNIVKDIINDAFDKQQIADILKEIPWDTITVDEFKEKLKEANININKSDEELDSLINTMKLASGPTADLTKQYAEIAKIITGLKQGDTISAEDYSKLTESAQNYFTMMMDGTFKLTGDAEEFYNLVRNQQISDFREQINNLKEKNSYNKELQSRNFDFDNLNKNQLTNINKYQGTFDYNAEGAKQQLDIIEAFNKDNFDMLEKVALWREQLNGESEKPIDTQMFSDIASAVSDCKTQFDNLDKTISQIDDTIYGLDLAIAESYTNIQDLKQAFETTEMSAEAFTQAAIDLDNALDIQNLNSEELKDYISYLKDAAKNSKELSDELKNNSEAAKVVAKSIMKMNIGIDDLANGWENWSSILKESSSSSEEYMEAMMGMRDAVANLLDVSMDFVSSNFIVDNLDKIKEASEGSAEAIDELKRSLSENIILNIISDNKLNSIKDSLLSEFSDLQDLIPDLEVGATLNSGDFITKAQKLIEDCKMTVEQANAMFDSLGFETTFASETQNVKQTVPRYITKEEVIDDHEEDGHHFRTYATSTYQDGVDTFWGEMEVPAIAVNGKSPKIESITKKATGSFNNYSSSNKGGTKGPGGKSVKGAKKGNEPDKKDKITDEPDRYWDINNAISKINEELERNEQLQKKIGAYQDHYAGKTLIKSLQKQNDLLKEKNNILDKQYENYKKLYEIQSQELGELKGKIGGNWNGNELTNYSELFQANVDKYNAAIAQYNAMSKEQQDASGKQMIENAKTAYDTYKDALDRYQKLYYNEMYDTENKLAEYRQQQLENQFKIIENNLKAWETEIQLKLDMTGLKRDWKAFMKEVETDFRKIYKDLAKSSGFDKDIFGTYTEDAETRIKQIEDVEAEIRKMDASKDANGVVQISDDMMFGSISEAQEKLKELQKELVDVGNSLNDMYEQVWDNYIEGLDQAKDNFEDINKEIEHLTNMLEYEKELIELIYGDKAYDMMNKYYTAQQNNIENQIKSTRTEAQFWEEQFEKAFEMNKDKHNVNKDDMSTWTEDMRKAYDEMISSQEKLNDLVLEGIKNLRDDYLNSIAKTLSEMDKAVWGMSFDDLKEDWDFIQKRADEYLDDVEGAYKIQTLANKINEGIANTDNLKAQQKLAKLRDEEMKMLREKERLTQDDIDLAEARYQIALKEIALEDAQNNKTSMKLSRDTSGNWTYQYVADEEDTESKRQELLDAYANLYEIADNAYNHAMELAMAMYEEYQEKFRQISEDTTLSEEEKYQKLMELQALYLPEIEAAFENSQIYQQETIMATAGVFAEVCEQDLDAYTTLTDYQKELIDSVRDHHLEDYEEIRSAIVDGTYPELRQAAEDTFLETNENSHTAAAQVIDDWDKGGDSVKAALNDAFKAVIGYTQDFEKELINLESISGRTITDAGGVVSDIEAISDAMEEAGYMTEEMADRATDSLDMLRDYVNDVEDAWREVIDRIREAIDALQEYLNTSEEVSAEEARREAEAAARAAEQARQRSTSGSSGSGGSSGSSGGGSSNQGVAGVERSGEKKNYFVSYWEYDEKGIKLNQEHRVEDLTLEEAQRKAEEIRKYRSNGRLLYDSRVQHYDTGGYTGDWDNQSGRLAMLHQKELVLNASDTENMLSAVNAIRDIAGLNESISQTIANSIGRLIMSAISPNSNITTTNTTTNDTSNNTFNITAEFPNANDVQTIKDAILSLPNIASQYVHMN